MIRKEMFAADYHDNPSGTDFKFSILFSYAI
jgi:hypothetical protein